MDPYRPDLYAINERNTCRYLLGISGASPLFVVGLNPSKADDQKPDPTIRRVMGFAQRNGYDGFVMLNLYPQRTPYPDRLHRRQNREIGSENLRQIERVLASFSQPHILACWGVNIGLRPYLSHYLREIYHISRSRSVSWLQIGHLTKAGHPRHPGRISYKLPFLPFDLERYLDKLNE